MEISQLYQFVLLIVLTSILVGVGVLLLDKFSSTTGVTTAASTSINASRNAVGEIATNWMSLIVSIGVLAVIIGLVLGAFALGGKKR